MKHAPPPILTVEMLTAIETKLKSERDSGYLYDGPRRMLVQYRVQNGAITQWHIVSPIEEAAAHQIVIDVKSIWSRDHRRLQ